MQGKQERVSVARRGRGEGGTGRERTWSIMILSGTKYHSPQPSVSKTPSAKMYHRWLSGPCRVKPQPADRTMRTRSSSAGPLPSVVWARTSPIAYTAPLVIALVSTGDDVRKLV